ATLSGVLVAESSGDDGGGRGVRPSLAGPAALFIAVVTASLAVAVGVGQAGLESRRLFYTSFGTFLWREYLVGGAGEWPGVAAAAALGGGVLWPSVGGGGTRRSIDASRPVILSVAAGAALAATANLVALAQSLASVDSVRTLVTRLMTSRISVQVTDVN